MDYIRDFFRDVRNIAYTRKFWTGLGGFLLLFLSDNYADRWWVQGIISVGTLLGIYSVPNKKK